MALDPALDAADALPRDAPQEALALVAVGGRSGRPGKELVGRRRGDRVDERLQRLLVHVHFLYIVWGEREERGGKEKKCASVIGLVLGGWGGGGG